MSVSGTNERQSDHHNANSFESLAKQTTYLETMDCSLAILKHSLHLLRTFQKLCTMVVQSTRESFLHNGLYSLPLVSESQDSAINDHDNDNAHASLYTILETRYSRLEHVDDSTRLLLKRL